MVEDGNGHGLEGGEAGFDGGGTIVAALHERAAAAIAEAVDERPMKCHVIVDTAVRTVAAASETFGDVRDRELVADDGVEGALFFGQNSVKGLCLRDGAGEAVEHESARATQAVAPLANEGDEGVVADEFAAVHAGLGVEAGGAAGEEPVAGGAEEFAGGERARA